MKKIILFVLMIIASVNLFSNELSNGLPNGLPSGLFYFVKKAYYYHNLVLEDIKHNDDIIELKDGYHLRMFDGESFGHFTYKTIATKNNKRELLVIFNEGNIYRYDIFKAEAVSGLLLTLCNIRIFNKEDVLLYEINYCLEGDNNIHECYFDYTTFTHYNMYE